MRKTFAIFLMTAVVLSVAGVAQAQYGIGRFERMQILANDLKESTRNLYLRADRHFPRYSSRSDRYLVNSMYRLYSRAADFENQLERNFDDPNALRRSYQRLYSAWYNAQYFMQGRYGYGPFLYEFRQVSLMVNQLGRAIPGISYDRRYDNFDDDRFDRYDDDDDHDRYDDYDD